MVEGFRPDRASSEPRVDGGQPVSRVLSSRLRRFTDKPSSRRLRPGRSSIWAARYRAAHAAHPTLNGDEPSPAPKGSASAWPCSGWGLPGRGIAADAGGLLHHRFTLAAGSTTAACRRRLFSVARSAGFPARGLPGTLLCGARTFLKRILRKGQDALAIARPTYRQDPSYLGREAGSTGRHRRRRELMARSPDSLLTCRKFARGRECLLVTDAPRPRSQTFRLDPRQWPLATQMAVSAGFVVALILAFIAWVVGQSTQETVLRQVGGSLQAEASAINNVVLLHFRERASQAQVLSQATAIRGEIETSNAGYSGREERDLAEIWALDRSWLTASADDPLIVEVTDPVNNPATARLLDFLADFPDHSELIVTDRYGGTVAASARISDYYQADEQWWLAAWNDGSGAIFVSQPTYDESAGVDAVLLALPVADPAGRPIGVLRSTLAVSELFSLLERESVGHYSDVLLVDGSGRVLFDSALESARIEPSAGSLESIPGLQSGQAGFDVGHELHGQPAVLGFAALRPASRQPQDAFETQLAAAVNDLAWTAVASQPVDPILRPVIDLQRWIGLAAAVSVLGFALVSFRLSHAITSPLRDLAAAAGRLPAGELGGQVPVRGGRELIQLTETFNRMSHQVRTNLQNMSREIEERKLAEAAAFASERRLKSTLDSMLEGAQIIGPDWRYLYVNDAVADQGKQTKEALLGRTMMEMYPGIEQTEVFARMRHCMEQRIPQYMENEFTFPDGSKGWFDLSVQPVPEGIFILSADITDRKRAMQDIRDMNRELEQRVRERTAELEAANQELESFSYSVSHDLRAPLRSIDGFTQALAEDYADRLDEQARDYTQRVRKAAQRMGMLIDDLLKLSRVTRAEMNRQTVDFSGVVLEIVEALRAAEPSREVAIAVQPDLTGRGDPELLRVALENLLSNAWKFTSRQAGTRIEFGATQVNGAPAYFVRDNGAGFDTQYAGKLFGAFQRLHSAEEYPGTGIGLATVQRVFLRHGGRVWAEGEVGKGAVFYFTLA